MKIAVASEGDRISEHFGHCESFNIFNVEDNKIIGVESISNPGHRPGFLPHYLNDLGVEVIISGGIGGGASQIFKDKGIIVITGARGLVREAVEDYLRGILKSSGPICQGNKHHDECGG